MIGDGGQWKFKLMPRPTVLPWIKSPKDALRLMQLYVALEG